MPRCWPSCCAGVGNDDSGWGKQQQFNAFHPAQGKGTNKGAGTPTDTTKSKGQAKGKEGKQTGPAKGQEPEGTDTKGPAKGKEGKHTGGQGTGTGKSSNHVEGQYVDVETETVPWQPPVPPGQQLRPQSAYTCNQAAAQTLEAAQAAAETAIAASLAAETATEDSEFYCTESQTAAEAATFASEAASISAGTAQAAADTASAAAETAATAARSASAVADSITDAGKHLPTRCHNCQSYTWIGNKVRCINANCARHPHVSVIDALHTALEEIEEQARK